MYITPNRRAMRIASDLRKIIEEVLRYRIRDKRLTSLSIQEVSISSDLSKAKIYYVSEGDLKTVLNPYLSKIRQYIAAKLNLRYTPHIAFIYDDQYLSQLNFLNLLDNI